MANQDHPRDASPRPRDDLDAGLEIALDEIAALRFAITGYRVDGLRRTHPNFAHKLLKSVISTGGTFKGAIEDTMIAVGRLRETGVFEGVDAEIDRDSSTTGVAVFTVNEKKSLRGNVGTSVRANERHDSSVELSGAWRNVTGRMDTLRASFSAGAPGSDLTAMFSNRSLDDTDKTTGVTYTAPYAFGLHTDAMAKVQRFVRHWPKSHFCERSHEANVSLSNEYLGDLEVGAAWREVCNLQPEASMLLREEAGHHWKASVRHRFVLDRRNDPAMPTAGWRLGTDVEIAGLAGMGDARYRKAEADLQVHLPIGTSGISLGGVLRGGVARGTNVSICDRFFLGGPCTLRGFAYRGVGPRESGTALGGEAYYTMSAFVSAPAPPHSLLSLLYNGRLHAFIQAGDVGDVQDIAQVFKGPRRMREAYKALRDNARVTTGVGIAGVTSLGRVEINWCHILAKAPSDEVGSSVQFNLTKEFL